jgi:hypothetical protein
VNEQVETLSFDSRIDLAANSYLDQEVASYRQMRVAAGRAVAHSCGSPVTYVEHMAGGRLAVFGRALSVPARPTRAQRLRENLAFAVFGAAMSAFVSVLLALHTSTTKTVVLLVSVITGIVALVVALTTAPGDDAPAEALQLPSSGPRTA